jgi:mono/diheme cytochrome c family protein
MGPVRRATFPGLMNLSRPASLAAFVLAMAPAVARSAGGPVVFSRDVLPILSDSCFQCHGPDAKEGRKGDLRLDDESDAKRDRDGHPVIAAGNPDASELVRRLLSTDPEEQMPPPDLGRPLSTAQIDTLKRWIAEGAKWGKHWSFERIERPAVPEAAGGRHPIDALVQRGLDAAGLKANPPADPATLLRRLSLDLTGLPPSSVISHQSSVISGRENPNPDHRSPITDHDWSVIIDTLLDSPHYGERMAWDWLDAARYADSNGYQGDNERTMWPWRDWVVKAFNENLPYDQFTIWQLAGDLLPGATPDQILATGFNRNHMINGEGGRIAEENRVDYVMDMSETMGTVWLGLTLNCCRCHDHKFDPLTQADYYRFTAFFNQTPVTGGGGNPQTPPVLEVAPPEAIAARDAARKERNAAKTRLDQATTAEKAELEKKASDKSAAEKATALKAEAEKAFQAAETKLKSLDDAIPKVMVMADQAEPRKTFLLDRGLYNAPGAEVAAGVPSVLLPSPDAKNRLDLARWLVSRDHPLTARVAVNRIWQMLFGIGLVKTAEDFGVQAEYPVQRELLDWLAAEYLESGWNTKALLKTIVTSETYRRSSVIASPSEFERDPENRLLARGPRFRMPSWMIRDQALAVSGLLEEQQGGPSVFPYQPEGIWDEATFGKKTYRMSEGADLHRRSLYTFWRRIVGPTEFFDTAKRQVCEVKPLRTNTPMHALTVLNSPTYVEAARFLADGVLRSHPDDTTRFETLSLRLLGRPATNEETAVWKRSLGRARTAFTADPTAASRLLAVGEAETKPGLDPIEHAAWTALGLNLLNLDETLTKE